MSGQVSDNSTLPDSNNQTDQHHPSHLCCMPQYILFAKILSPFLIAGTIGNLLTLIYLVSTSEKKSPMNLLILNQTLAALILSAVVYPGNITAAITGFLPHPDNHVTPLVFGTLFAACNSSAFLSVFFISLNRVLAIIYYDRCGVLVRQWFSLVGIFLSWLTPLLFLLPIIAGWLPDVVMRSAEVYPLGTAVPRTAAGEAAYQKYAMSGIVVCVLLPSIGTAACYLAVWVSATRRRQRVGVLISDGGNLTVILTKRIQAAKLSAITGICFFLTYYPLAISIIVRRGTVPPASHRGPVAVLMLLLFLMWSGSCLNPVIMGLLNARYRRWCWVTVKRVVIWGWPIGSLVRLKLFITIRTRRRNQCWPKLSPMS